MTELIDFLGFETFDVSRRKRNSILEFLGLKDYKDKKDMDVFIIRVG